MKRKEFEPALGTTDICFSDPVGHDLVTRKDIAQEGSQRWSYGSTSAYQRLRITRRGPGATP
jgi:hypothetical protein